MPATIYFTGPRQVAFREENLPEIGEDQVLVETILSAISPGSEVMVYRGEFPDDFSVDETITALSGEFRYPIRYGYSVVGKVQVAGKGVDPAWVGKTVFAFHPHCSHFPACPEELMPVPDGITSEQAIFLPNMETAVNLVLDGAPLIGEKVTVFGQGIVGLLATALLAKFPLGILLTLDRYPKRRRASLELGAMATLDPYQPDFREQVQAILGQGSDLTYEVSGVPAALDQAIAVTRYSGRLVVGSWYGRKTAELRLGGSFHRRRIRLFSSQVSTLSPELSGRWDKTRRFQVAWDMIRQVQPARFITHSFPITQAEQAYQLLDEDPQETIQVVFTYEGA